MPDYFNSHEFSRRTGDDTKPIVGAWEGFSRRAPARRPIAVALASAIAYSIAVFGTTCSAFALPSDTRLDLARVVFAFAEECARASNARVHTVANAFFICVPHNLCLKARRANARPR